LATAELREHNEKSRAEHADGQLKLASAQLERAETRVRELESILAAATEGHRELQKSERQLRDSLAGAVPRQEHREVKDKLESAESSLNALRSECDRLREVSDVAKNQIELLECSRHSEAIEPSSLRDRLLDLESQSDNREECGRLHRQWTEAQVREKEQTRRAQLLAGKCARLETQLFRLTKRADEAEDNVSSTRTYYQVKIQTLVKTVHDLRRQYAGAVPLARQEAQARATARAEEERRRTRKLLKEAEEKAAEAEIKEREMIVKQEGLEELQAALQERGGAARQLRDWQRRLEETRLREVRSRASAERWRTEADRATEAMVALEARTADLEEEVVRLESQLERGKALVDVEVVDLEGKEGDVESSAERDLVLPNPDAPLAQQMEQALKSLRSHAKLVEDLKRQLLEAKKVAEETQRRAREVEASAAAKDRIINDLRLQVRPLPLPLWRNFYLDRRSLNLSRVIRCRRRWMRRWPRRPQRRA